MAKGNYLTLRELSDFCLLILGDDSFNDKSVIEIDGSIITAVDAESGVIYLDSRPQEYLNEKYELSRKYRESFDGQYED